MNIEDDRRYDMQPVVRAELCRLRAENERLAEQLEVGRQIEDSFWVALKPLGLKAIHTQNPGQHITDLIAENERLRAIADGLPTDAEGNRVVPMLDLVFHPIRPGTPMEVWSRRWIKEHRADWECEFLDQDYPDEQWFVDVIFHDQEGVRNFDLLTPVSECYLSTESAARAAKGQP